MAVRRESDTALGDSCSVGRVQRGIGPDARMFVKGMTMSGVKQEDVPVELNI